MAYHIDPYDNALVIDGFESGIADSPHQGIADMRCVNPISVPGEASVNFKTSALTIPPTVTTLAFSVETTDIFTVASTSGWYNGMAITLDTVVTAVGPVTSRVYWVGDLSGATFKLYKGPSLKAGLLLDVTTAGTGTLSSYTLSTPLDRTVSIRTPSTNQRSYIFILDDAGRAWWVQNTGGTITNNLVYIGNDTLTAATNCRAIVVFQGYIIIFRSSTTDYLALSRLEGTTDLDSGTGWVYGWESVSSSGIQRRAVIAAQDNALYYDNSGRVGSIVLTGNASGFDPNDSSTYTKNTTALDLPNNEEVISLGEQGINLLVGGTREYVYPWNRVSTSFNYPIIIPDTVTYRIVTLNNSTYLFAGNRGRIYVTNGSNADLYKKFPDYVSGVNEPYFAWQDAIPWRGQMYFSFNATTNAGTPTVTTSGVWAIDMASKALRCTNQLSYATYSGTVSVLVPNIITTNPSGGGIYAGWASGGSVGVDVSSTSPYTNSEALIETDLVPLGTYESPRNACRVEYKLRKPLVSGESITLKYRLDPTASFSDLLTDSTVGNYSKSGEITFSNSQWIQFQVLMSSTVTTPSYVPLKEIRITRLSS